MSIMTVDEYQAKVVYDPELDMFRGAILGLNGGADFYGKNPKELKRKFKKSLQVVLDACKEKGIEPTKNYSGKFNLRLTKGLHSRIAIEAASEDMSINQWVAQALEKSVDNRHLN